MRPSWGRYLLTAGVLRFGIERVNERVAFGLSVAHFISLGAIAVSSIVLLNANPTRRTVFGSQRS